MLEQREKDDILLSPSERETGRESKFSLKFIMDGCDQNVYKQSADAPVHSAVL